MDRIGVYESCEVMVATVKNAVSFIRMYHKEGSLYHKN